MYLYSYLPLKSFVESCNRSETPDHLSLQLLNLMYAVPENEMDYGLSLLRRSIVQHEVVYAVSSGESKRNMPFFRNRRKMLVGPEMEMYVQSFFESEEIPHGCSNSEEPLLRIAFDYERLGEFCISANLYLLRCKYEEEKNLQTFVAQMEREYSRFFFDDEHTGFTADSRFFSMLCNACLEVREPVYSGEKEWRMVRFCPPEEAAYEFTGGVLYPSTSVSVPLSSIRRIELLDSGKHDLNYSALAGFLQQVGLAPEQYLEGLIEND